jgi:hypothetical protein
VTEEQQQEEQLCEHQNALVACAYDLIGIMYQAEEQMKDKTPEERLGFVVNAVSGVIYAASQAMGIESWYMQAPDGQVIQVTPTVQELPKKSTRN